jgi:hypothetical protein
VIKIRMVVVPVAAAADMGPNLVERDSYLARFDRFDGSAERLREQRPRTCAGR